MKAFSFLMSGFLVLLAAVGFGQNDLRTTEDYGLKGPVETISTDYYTMGKKNKPAMLLMSLEYEFSKTGDLDEYTFELSFFNLQFTSKYIRNEKGQVIREETVGEEENTVTATYTYDDAGLLIERKTYYSDGDVKSTTTYSYNSAGKVTLIDVDSEASYENVKYSYEYDDEGRITEYKESWKYVKEETTYKYDEDGNIVEEFFRTNTTDKDAKGNYYTYRTFNGNGDVIEEVEKDEEGKILGITRMEYDNDGNLTHRYSFNKKNKLQGYTVYSEFDEHGNWTESATFDGKKLTSMDSREIEYY